ncbi:class B sortase [Lacrimispora sp. 210928-DFI.3.58]|uniref:class B sortase n=1 Tax=Lacrimispora sp. 210928-DFI.3.58 TaxID=2883214 RepID=UPI0015B5CE30|nr:class B sortase [Lacrimispora sp. 210928-DFI.3.58]MCB7318611.1 class B sortase [Lacrimispora sp. 210928-DFI.3.58]
MRKNGARCLLILAAGAILAGGAELLLREMEGSRRDREYQSLAEAVRETEAEVLEIRLEEAEETESTEETREERYCSPIDFEALWEINPEVVGWITIPGTKIDYPILQAGDNDKYLHHDIHEEENAAGAIYLDFESEKDFSGYHNILYGHNMRNGSMFKDIVKFKEQAYFDAHRDIYIYTPDREFHLKAAAALYTTPDAIRRKTEFLSQDAFDSYVEEMTAGASAKAVLPEIKKPLFSFVTCSYEFSDARTILYAWETE